jgi:hypothetical protein
MAKSKLVSESLIEYKNNKDISLNAIQLNENIYTRDQIIDLIYSEYKEPQYAEVLKKIKKKMMRYTDEEFMDMCKNSGIHLEMIRRNSYYMTR